MPAERSRAAVLISGRGSNLAALADAALAEVFPAEIVLVISNNPEAAGLARAAERGIATAVIDHRAHATKADFENQLDAALRAARIDLVCLAGFMRLLSTAFVEAWRDRMLNIHPSLLPKYPGLHTHDRALAAGDTEHGATVHFVRTETDSGPIVVQGVVPVLPGDSAATLSARVLAIEHRIYPLALELVARGAALVQDDRVIVAAADQPDDPTLRWP